MRFLHIAIALMLLITIPLVSDPSEGDLCFVRISHVYPTESFEGFALTNYGSARDLAGFSVSDGEGTVKFIEPFRIGKLETVYFCKSEVPSWFGMERVVYYGQNGVTMKGIALADSGDDLYLYCGGQLIDAFVYGDVKKFDGGWNGEPFQRIAKKHMAVRDSIYDTDSSKDWKLTVPGRTDYQTETFDAMVTPISFPDDYSPLFYALQGASRSVDISVYLISHPDAVSSLLESLQKGVSVRILVEGSPAGGMTESEIKALKTLSSKGADVRVMKQADGYRAFNYIHSKYAVIDCTKTVITSENWQESSFSSNRGWGAVIESTGFSAYMGKVFQSDFTRKTDVIGFNDLYPTAETAVYGRYVPVADVGTAYAAKAVPVLSPDNSYESMRSFISSAERRVYSEQLDVDYSWTSADDCPVSWMKEVSNRADCRLLVDTTFDDRNDSDYKDGFGVIDALSASRIQAKSPEFEGMTHNKGVISDDRTWIGSVNWTSSSFSENREAAVIVYSKDVADYFSELFLKDWGIKAAENPVREYSVNVQNIDDTFLFEAEGLVGDEIVYWDLDGDGMFETSGKKAIARFTDGRHDVWMKVDDGSEISSLRTSVVSNSDDRNAPAVPIKYYPVIAICISVILINAVRWVRHRDDPDKGIQRGRR